MVLADEARPPLAFLIIGITMIIMITTQLSFLSFLSLSLLCHRIFNAVIMILFGKGKKKERKKNGDDPNDTVTSTAPQHERADRRQLQQHHFISFKGPFVSSLVSKHHTCYSSSRIHHHSQGPKIKLKISTKPCCSPEMGGGRAGGLLRDQRPGVNSWRGAVLTWRPCITMAIQCLGQSINYTREARIMRGP